MRTFRVPALLLAAALLVTVAALSGADSPAPAAPVVVELPGTVGRGAVAGDHFYAITQGGNLIDVDLKDRRAMTLGNFATYLVPCVDAADGKALIASTGEVFVIDLATGKPIRSMEFKCNVRGLGFLDGDRVFVRSNSEVTVLDLAARKVLHTIDFLPRKEDAPSKREVAAGFPTAHCRVGSRLYVVSFLYGKNLSVLDLENGKLLEQASVSWYWPGSVCVAGDRAFVAGINLSYGINDPHFGCVDLKTQKYTELNPHVPGDRARVPLKEESLATACAVVGCSDGVVYAEPNGGIHQYDAEGKLLGTTPLPKDAGRLVGAWNGHALLAGKESLQLVKLAK